MEFYNRVINQYYPNKLNPLDISLDTVYSCLLSIIYKNNLYLEEDYKSNYFTATTRELLSLLNNKYQFTKALEDNDDIYYFLQWLDNNGLLEEYLKQDIKILPKYEAFYEEINEKLGLKSKGKNKTYKRCPKCNLIPLLDFDDVCFLCKN